MRNKTVIIRSIRADYWSGFHRFPKCKDSVIATFGRNGYDLGLTNEELRKLEKELGLQEDQLAPFSNYLKQYVVWIGNEQLTLDLSKPKDYLDYLILLKSERVAESREQLDFKPKAEYIIVDKAEDAKRENVKVKEEKKAMMKFGKMTIPDMKKVLKLLGKRVDTSTDEAVENALFDIIKRNPEDFMRVVGVADMDLRLLIEDLLYANILRKKGSTYSYGDDVIGYSLDETIDHLKDIKNQDLIISLKGKLEAKQKITA